MNRTAEDAATVNGEKRMADVMARKAPPLFWTLTEGRGVFELGSFYGLRRLMRRLPKGDGHPVIVLPGFVASDRSTAPMRAVLDDLGYQTFGWGLGRNLTFNDRREAEMLALLRRVYRAQHRKVSIIGWSLGGVFAREIAKSAPNYVRSVISLGSPISGDTSQTSATRLYEFINGKASEDMEARLNRLSEAPPVPTTSIYSKSDGIVSWKGSIQPPGPLTENIRVPASHMGLGVNPVVMYAIADRLAQQEGDWTPFDKTGVKKLLFR